ncbi:MAG TPA: polysaccharide deacetylase family protein [Galbitalea sp.]
MSGVGRAVVVRRRDIESDPRPPGGRFAESAVLPVPASSPIAALLSVFCVNTTERVLAITFDDGPHQVFTPKILDILAAFNVKATFFVLARQVEKYPDVARRIIADGHEIGVHGQDHTSLLTMSTGAARSGIAAARARIESVTGVPIRLYRAPYGANTVRQAAIIRSMGLLNVSWSADGLDWLDDDASAIAARALYGVFPGSILLLHDDRGDPETLAPGEMLPAFDRAEVVELVLSALAERGYTALTAGALLAGYQQVRSAAKNRMLR